MSHHTLFSFSFLCGWILEIRFRSLCLKKKKKALYQPSHLPSLGHWLLQSSWPCPWPEGWANALFCTLCKHREPREKAVVMPLAPRHGWAWRTWVASWQPFVEHQSVVQHVGTILHFNKPTGLVLPQIPKEETGSEKLNYLPEISVYNVCKSDPNGPLGGLT